MTLPDSPCRGVCTTTYDEVCRACGRHYLEVAHWVTFAPETKQAIWDRIQADPRYRWDTEDQPTERPKQ